MSELRATVAIARRQIDRRFALDWAMQFAIVSAIAYAFATTFPQPLGPVAIASVLCAANAAERAHVAALRRLTFFTAPLFGRQLARAHAVAPALLALAVPLGYAAGAALRRAPLTARDLALAIVAALLSATIALSAIFRDGAPAWFYLGLAATTAFGVAYGIDALAPGRSLGFTLAVAATIGFFALRGFGETLARYDPVPEDDATA